MSLRNIWTYSNSDLFRYLFRSANPSCSKKRGPLLLPIKSGEMGSWSLWQSINLHFLRAIEQVHFTLSPILLCCCRNVYHGANDQFEVINWPEMRKNDEKWALGLIMPAFGSFFHSIKVYTGLLFSALKTMGTKNTTYPLRRGCVSTSSHNSTQKK